MKTRNVLSSGLGPERPHAGTAEAALSTWRGQVLVATARAPRPTEVDQRVHPDSVVRSGG